MPASRCLGAKRPRRDKRNIKFAALSRAALPPPVAYDFDAGKTVPTPVFGNDRYGCCVISGRAHQTLRFELLEQKKILGISTADVTKEYFTESGGRDSGLVVLSSLKLWRSRGWTAAGKSYKIIGFAELNRAAHDEIKQAVFADVGVGIALALPISAQSQKTWGVVSGSRGQPYSWGGHYVYVNGYNSTGPICVTWGAKKQMTWAFFAKYCTEAYAIFDAVNVAAVKTKRLVDVRKLRKLVREVSKN